MPGNKKRNTKQKEQLWSDSDTKSKVKWDDTSSFKITE